MKREPGPCYGKAPGKSDVTRARRALNKPRQMQEEGQGDNSQPRGLGHTVEFLHVSCTAIAG